MRLAGGARSAGLALGTLGIGLAAVAAPIAAADPAVPAEPVVPASAADPAEPVPATPADPAAPVALAAPASGLTATDPAAAAPATASITPPDGVSHLPSPDSLPPGTTSVAQAAQGHPTLGYLKDVWNAVRGKEVSPSDALLLLAQRPVDNSKIATSVPQQEVVNGQAPAAAPAPAEPAPVPVAIPVPAAEAPAG